MHAPRAFAFAAAVSAALWTSGCGGDDQAPPAQFAEECMDDCAEGLMCITRTCTAACGSDEACRPYSPTAICSAGFCFEPCVTREQCPPNLTCQMVATTQGTCRAP